MLDLKRTLPKSAYADRLQEELSDHFDDAVYAEMIAGTKETPAIEKTITRLGSTSVIAKEFYTSMRHQSPSSLYLEAAAIGFFSVPIYVLMLALGPQVASTMGLVVFPVSGIIFFYRITLASLLRFVESREHLPYLLGVILGIPTIVVFVVIRGWRFGFSGNPTPEMHGFYLYLIICGASAVGASLYYSRKIYHDQLLITQGNQQPSTFNQILTTYGVMILSMLLLASTLITTFVHAAVRDPLASILFPLAMIRFVPEFFVNAAITFFPDLVLMYWITGIAVAAVTFVSMYHVMRNLLKGQCGWKTLPWFPLAVVSYGVCLLLFPSVNMHRAEPVFSVPSKSISEVIERKELGPFYPMVKYLNDKEGRFTRYTIATIKDGFEISQKGNKQFTLKNLQSVDSMDLVGPTSTTSESAFTLADVSCFDVGQQITVRSSTTNPSDVQTCHDLYINGKKVFEMPGNDGSMALSLRSDVAVSENGEWALINLYTFFYDPNEVYLVDLR